MSKLKLIQNELEANRAVFVAPVDVWPGVDPKHYSGLESSCAIDICVAPINEMYLPDELNRLMGGLVSVEPERKHPFSLWRDFESQHGGEYTSRLRLGWMSFIEKIGQKRIDGETIRLVLSRDRDIEAEDLKELIKRVMPDGEPGVDIDIYRGILLRVYPNTEIAKGKFGKNDLGAEMTLHNFQEFVSKPTNKRIYQLFEAAYADRNHGPTPMEELRSNLGNISQVKVQ